MPILRVALLAHLQCDRNLAAGKTSSTYQHIKGAGLMLFEDAIAGFARVQLVFIARLVFDEDEAFGICSVGRNPVQATGCVFFGGGAIEDQHLILVLDQIDGHL